MRLFKVGEVMEFNDDEVRTKGKMYTFMVIALILVIVFICLSVYFSFKALGEDLSKKNYYYVDINEKNKDEIIRLLNEEKDDMISANYCDSMYKIEYYNTFPDGTSYTIYCKNMDNINFSIDKASEDKLQSYIYKYGDMERK